MRAVGAVSGIFWFEHDLGMNSENEERLGGFD
jgi:hypothetical protein